MRASGLSLNDYLLKHIMEPLGIKDINMFPTEDMKRRLAYMHQRAPDGTLSVREDDHPFKRPLKVETPEEIKATYNSGGAGCFAVPSEYCKIIAVLLNGGKCPKTGAQILKPESVKELFTNQIPEFPNFGRQGIIPAKPSLSNPIPDMYPQPNQPQGWTLSGFHHLHGTATGRAPGTIWWAGIANLFWWADPERGLGGFIASQILPFADLNVLTAMVEVESALYAAIST